MDASEIHKFSTSTLILKKKKCRRMQVSIVLFAFVYESQPKVNKANFLASFIDVLRDSFFSSVLSQYLLI